MASPDPVPVSKGERGFALILALMALVLLTTLGLTLTATTSTELRIATNYRWSEQAYHNAESGIELGKRYLRQLDWRILLWPSREYGVDTAPSTVNLPARTGPEGEPSRNFELQDCDTDPNLGGNVGFGVVLDDLNEAFPFQNSSQFLGTALNGTITLWVRRKIEMRDDGSGTYVPYELPDADSRVILTAEGTAPFSQGGATGTYQMMNRAVRYIEVELTRQDPNDCENRSAQAGSGPSGSGYDQCDVVSPGGVAGGADEVNTGLK